MKRHPCLLICGLGSVTEQGLLRIIFELASLVDEISQAGDGSDADKGDDNDDRDRTTTAQASRCVLRREIVQRSLGKEVDVDLVAVNCH